MDFVIHRCNKQNLNSKGTNLQTIYRFDIGSQITLSAHENQRCISRTELRCPLVFYGTKRFWLDDGKAKQKHIAIGIGELAQIVKRILSGSVVQQNVNYATIDIDFNCKSEKENYSVVRKIFLLRASDAAITFVNI